MTDTVISVENLSKHYPSTALRTAPFDGAQDSALRQAQYRHFDRLSASLRSALMNNLQAPLRSLRRIGQPAPAEETTWALKDVRTQALTTRLPLKQVWLFGSWAWGKATAFSDIDLLVIYADPPREDAYKLVWRAVQVRGVEPHVYSEGQAQPLKAT